MLLFVVFAVLVFVLVGLFAGLCLTFNARLIITSLNGHIVFSGEHFVVVILMRLLVDWRGGLVSLGMRGSFMVVAGDDFAFDHIAVVGVAILMIALGRGFADALIRAGALVGATAARLATLAIVIILFVAMLASFFFEKGQTISNRDLIIIRVDFRKG